MHPWRFDRRSRIAGDFSYNLVYFLNSAGKLMVDGRLKNLVGGAFSAFNVGNLNN
jgi:hypothetical protein